MRANTCRQCRHWKNEQEQFNFSKDVGFCTAAIGSKQIAFKNQFTEHSIINMFEPGYTMLVTRGGFGCKLFERKECKFELSKDFIQKVKSSVHRKRT